jgi:hypothetical protein
LSQPIRYKENVDFPAGPKDETFTVSTGA